MGAYFTARKIVFSWERRGEMGKRRIQPMKKNNISSCIDRILKGCEMGWEIYNLI